MYIEKKALMLASQIHRFIMGALLMLPVFLLAQPDDPRQKHFSTVIRPMMKKHCWSCHNGEDNKAGINLERYDFINTVVRSGELFHKVMEVIEEGSMPPDIRPPMPESEKDTFNFYINGYLQKALEEKDPGLIPPRKLNNQEFRYAIKDLLDVDVHVDSIFPSDPSGGEGFDNHAPVLFLSPLLIERYFETAEYIVDELYADTKKWRTLVPKYRLSFGSGIRNLWYKATRGRDVSAERPALHAEKILFPLATKAYRRFLSAEDKDRIHRFFIQIYKASKGQSHRFDISLKESLKYILLSPNFLFRQEADPEREQHYPITNFELASRLSFFLWSSIPDIQLLQVAYREDLHDSTVLEREIHRMLRDPKAKRLGKQFAIQWLELKKLNDPAFQVDPEVFPAYTPILRDLMLKEVEMFFNHAFLERKNFLDLLDSDYSFVNDILADHYGMEGVEGEHMRQVQFASNQRGGLFGMAGVLTATSLPTRTSPVLRGKWVLEQILGTPAPPPPADVPELEASHDSTKQIQTLRELIEKHREDPACAGCHKAMDPIGLGLENFDGIGRWRNAYGEELIDPSGVLKSGEEFKGPSELREILLTKKELFAKNFSKKMLAFALGRSLGFKDTPTIDHLKNTLVETDFHSIIFITEIIRSFPFRYKKSDNKDVPQKADGI